jgi:hypothetical protein
LSFVYEGIIQLGYNQLFHFSVYRNCRNKSLFLQPVMVQQIIVCVCEVHVGRIYIWQIHMSHQAITKRLLGSTERASIATVITICINQQDEMLTI